MRIEIVIAVVFLMLAGLVGMVSAQPEKVMADYTAALKAGQWAKAESLWVSDDIAASKRLGIEYIAIRPNTIAVRRWCYILNRSVPAD
jgi:hypothetical protein